MDVLYVILFLAFIVLLALTTVVHGWITGGMVTGGREKLPPVIIPTGSEQIILPAMLDCRGTISVGDADNEEKTAIPAKAGQWKIAITRNSRHPERIVAVTTWSSEIPTPKVDACLGKDKFVIGIDSGLCALLTSHSTIPASISIKKYKTIKQNGNTIGIVVSTGYGDGIYGVQIKKKDNNLAVLIRVVFLEE